MSDTGVSLGPLERIDGRWVVGESRKPGGTWLEFRTEGLYQHARDSEGQLIPWSRIMILGRCTVGARYPRGSHSVKALLDVLPGPWRGHGRGYLHMTLRHPYEDWLAPFSLHPRWYSPTEFELFQELLGQTDGAGEIHRLGDADWLGRVVEQLAPQRPWTAWKIHDAVNEARGG
ncbi:hypothetical protein [Streptomyces roseoverticillatus]|uniref:hypothetical protein n=1 Tax=Streptomyces roseoverticillatus TaxID=66429 RepID=UPI001FE1F79D|nr:hypothetical protein [Streptomyces roseoverticillatus]